MLFQIVFPLSLVVAVGAREGHLVMSPKKMGCQVCLSGGPVVTVGAGKGLLSGVDSEMSCQVAVLDPSEVAVGAGKGPLDSVDAEMFCRVTCPCSSVVMCASKGRLVSGLG